MNNVWSKSSKEAGAEREGAEVKERAAPAEENREEKRLDRSELLRAPVSQYMSAEQLAFFRERLLDTQRSCWRRRTSPPSICASTSSRPIPTDQATIEEEYALELRARDRERKLLKKIDEALRRIEEGSYGYCEETGEPIGIARLIARPTATLSVEAQTRREQKQRLYGRLALFASTEQRAQ